MTEWLLGAAVVAAGLFSIRYAWWRPSVANQHPRILMYHMIRDPRPKARFNKLRVPPREFEWQLEWLVAHGWEFAFVSELAALPHAAKTVVLTFDDGFRDNYLAAHPLLEKYGAKATLYLVVDRMGRDWSTARKAHHDSGELGAEEKLADDEVRAMLASGRWELGAHSLTHPVLPNLAPEERVREVAESKTALEESFGVEVRSFAYPFGIHDDADCAAVAAAGYRYAVTTQPGISTDLNADALQLKRIRVSGKERRLGFALRLRTGLRGS